MKKSPARIFACLLMLLLLRPCLNFAEELSDNLIKDGGMEQWKAIGPNDPGWDHLTISHKLELAHDEKGNVLKPHILSQLYGDARVLKRETNDVHGGTQALRLKGQFYLANNSSPDAFKTREGDVYIVRYWVKGKGDSLMHMEVYGDAGTERMEVKGKPEKERWSLIEERFLITGRAPTTIYPRLWASEELLIDDVFVGRVIRPEERTQVLIPSDCQERIAFAATNGGAITLDGKFDEPAWSKAVSFSGFRMYGDQTLLSSVQPSFRVLFDARNLYFGVEIPLANARKVLEELKKQPLLDGTGKLRSTTDTFTSRESIELFLQAPGRSRYCQFVASLDGYRYDGAGMDKDWNGTWECATSVADDRWFLEMKIPITDLGIEQMGPTEGWRLNLCCNRTGGGSTWAAVGQNFHNPGAFGKLITQEFGAWYAQQPALRVKQKAEILQAAGPRSALYTKRLAALDAALAPAAGETAAQPRDWQSITRVYFQLDYIGYAYRCAAEEVRYCNFLQ